MSPVDDDHIYGSLANSSVLGGRLSDDDLDVNALCLDYCPNTTASRDAACRLPIRVHRAQQVLVSDGLRHHRHRYRLQPA